MKQLAIKAENISKQYRLGEVGTGTLSHDLNRFWYKIRGKENPYLKIGESNNRSKKGNSEYVWSLRNINFEIKQGDAVGIIGRNGAGKSTLLKLLSKVTKPTTGTFKINGRIASLLEVGTGFHPEMTGRENIYLNGAILGMRKHEISRKFDEIVDFSGVERYIDTPVKRYSSGMYVRLAFAVAANLESEILIVDEVLAVGDAEFQKKCLGKMGEVSKGEGRSVLFVSHNMAAVKNLCSRGIVLADGEIISNGKVNESVERYLNSNNCEVDSHYLNNNPSNQIDILEIKILKNGKEVNSFSFDENVCIEIITIQLKKISGLTLTINVFDFQERRVFSSDYKIRTTENKKGERKYRVTIPNSILSPNSYKVTVAIQIPNVEIIKFLDSIVRFSIEETGTGFEQYGKMDLGCVILNCDWQEI